MPFERPAREANHRYAGGRGFEFWQVKKIRSSLTGDKISGQHFVALPRSVVTRRRGDGLAAPLFVARRHADRVSSRGAASNHRQGRRRHQLRPSAVALLHLSHVQVMTLF